jgi:hypothetical protein
MKAGGWSGCGLALILRGRLWTTGLVWLVILLIGHLPFAHPAVAAPAVVAGLASLVAGWLWGSVFHVA